MAKYKLIISAFFLSIGIVKGQDTYEGDALRYSQSTISGSARTQAIAGANVALGADISSANLNPAGLGLFKKNEFSISASLGSANTTTVFNNKSSDSGSKIFFGIPNFGIVLTSMKDDLVEGKYRGGTFGLSFTKVNNFQNTINYSGINTDNSIADYLAETAKGTSNEQLIDLEESNSEYNDDIRSLWEAAYLSDIIDPKFIIRDNNGVPDTIQDPNREFQYSFFSNQQKQSESILTQGGQYKWDLSYGGNYDDVFYFGVGLGITKINYRRERYFNEDVSNEELSNINIFDTYSAKGTGINVKGGFIIKPVDALRIGLSVQSATIYSIKETWDVEFNSILSNKDYPLSLVGGDNKFNLTTPGKISPGIAVIIGKWGFLTTELDYIPYHNSSIGSASAKNVYSENNNRIKELYKGTFNYRVGGEFRYEIFRLRGGFALHGDPYKNNFGINRSVMNITAGFGVRFQEYYADFAIINSRFKSIYSPYTMNNGTEPKTQTTNNLTTLNFTFGVFF